MKAQRGAQLSIVEVPVAIAIKRVESALRSEVDPDELDGLGYERAMLKEVLSWLSVSPDDSEE